MTLRKFAQRNWWSRWQTSPISGLPTLAEVLKWADGKAILSLDIKGGIQPETIVDTIAAYAAESHVMVITYNLATARNIFSTQSQIDDFRIGG